MKVLQFLAITLALAAGPVAAEVYKWTDEHGRVHYGDRKVQGSKKIKIKTSPAQKAQEAAGDEVSEEALDPERCATEREKLTTYENADRLIQTKPDGTEVAISDAERKALIASQRSAVKVYCGDDS